MKKEMIDDVLEGLDESELESEIKEESKFSKQLKRTYIIVIALLMTALLLVSTDAGIHIVSVVSGKIVSSDFNDYTFGLKNGKTVVFSPSVWDELTVLYDRNRQHEIKVCLIGHENEGDYFIEGMYVPTIYSQEVYSVTAQACNNETVISLHSHPPLQCIFSEQDIKSYNDLKKKGKETLYALMCHEKRITFYGYG